MKRVYALTMIVALLLLAGCAAPAEPLPDAENPAGGIAPAVGVLPDAENAAGGIAPAEGEQPAEEVPFDAATGGVRTLPMMDRSLLQFPVQAPGGDQMEALIEGTLVVDNRCLRVVSEEYPAPGFLVIWPAGFEPRIGPADGIDIVDGSGEVVAHPDEAIRLSGGAMESEETMANWDTIPGMPIDGCPGPYWIAGDVVR